MREYWKTFPSRAFIAVVHSATIEQTLRNVKVAFDNGADGVFLVTHSIPPYELARIYKRVREKYPLGWIGLNMGLDAYSTFLRLSQDTNGFWADDAGITATGVSDDTEKFLQYRLQRPSWRALYFGGVAFSEDSDLKDPGEAARRATAYVDVVVTSGAKIGSAPDPAKIHKMKRALDEVPLAIAGGITAENVHMYLEWADCFLVASGIRASVTELDPKLVRALADKIHV